MQRQSWACFSFMHILHAALEAASLSASTPLAHAQCGVWAHFTSAFAHTDLRCAANEAW